MIAFVYLAVFAVGFLICLAAQWERNEK